MTTRFTLTTEIAAPIEVVYDLARDLDLHARSMAHTGERAIGGRTTGRLELGETVTWRARHFGIWWTLTSVVTAAEAPTRFVDEQAQGPFVSFHHEHRFERLGAGTRMTDQWEHRSPLGPLGWVVDHLILGRYLRDLLERRNRAIKATAERDQGAGSTSTATSAASTAANSG